MTTPPTPPQLLPLVERPISAVAASQQRTTTTALRMPRGIQSARSAVGTPTTKTVPHSESAFYFKELASGYTSAQCIGLCVDAGDALKLLSAEAAELTAAGAAGTTTSATTGADGSLAPRGVAIWLLCNPSASQNVGSHTTTATETLLNAFAALGDMTVGYCNPRMCTRTRLSFAAGVDSAFVLDQLQREACGTGCNADANNFTRASTGACIVVRVFDELNDCFKAYFRILDIANTSAVSSSSVGLVMLQEAIVRVCGTCDIAVDPALMIPVNETVPIDAFLKIQHKVAEEFFNLGNGKPVMQTSPAVAKGNPLHPTGILVRLIDRTLPSAEALTHSSCFHGGVLSPHAKIEAARRFMEQLDGDGGMKMPISRYENEIGLHVCAVHTEGLQLGTRVSLFGNAGLAGKPIHSPGSWLWVNRPAIRPIDAHLLSTFALVPCTRESLIPKQPELCMAFKKYWAMNTDLFRSQTENEPVLPRVESSTSLAESETTAEASSPTPSPPSPPSSSPPPKDDKDKEKSKEEATPLEHRVILAAAHLDLKSARTTLGEAYAHMMQHGGKTALTSNLKIACACLGVRSSLVDLFEHNAAALQAQMINDDTVEDARILRELCDVALGLKSDDNAKRQKTEKNTATVCMPAERVRRILSAVHLKRGSQHVTLDHGTRSVHAFPIFIEMVTEVLRISITDATVLRMLHSILHKSLSTTDATQTWQATVLGVLTSSIMMACTHAKLENVEVFAIVAKEDRVELQKIDGNGNMTPATFDALVSCAEPRVVIAQMLHAGKSMRLTATVGSGNGGGGVGA